MKKINAVHVKYVIQNEQVLFWQCGIRAHIFLGKNETYSSSQADKE